MISPPRPVETASTISAVDAASYAATFTRCNLVSDASSLATIAASVVGFSACPDDNRTACLAEDTTSTVAKYAKVAADRAACIAGGYPPSPPLSSAPAPSAPQDAHPGEPAKTTFTLLPPTLKKQH